MSFDYHEPTSIREAGELGARFGAESRFLAGGTDLMVQIHRGWCAPRHVVNLHRVAGLDSIDVDGTIALGALVTRRRLERAPAFQGSPRALVESAEVIGGHAVYAADFALPGMTTPAASPRAPGVGGTPRPSEAAPPLPPLAGSPLPPQWIPVMSPAYGVPAVAAALLSGLNRELSLCVP